MRHLHTMAALMGSLYVQQSLYITYPNQIDQGRSTVLPSLRRYLDERSRQTIRVNGLQGYMVKRRTVNSQTAGSIPAEDSQPPPPESVQGGGGCLCTPPPDYTRGIPPTQLKEYHQPRYPYSCYRMRVEGLRGGTVPRSIQELQAFPPSIRVRSSYIQYNGE